MMKHPAPFPVQNPSFIVKSRTNAFHRNKSATDTPIVNMARMNWIVKIGNVTMSVYSLVPTPSVQPCPMEIIVFQKVGDVMAFPTVPMARTSGSICTVQRITNTPVILAFFVTTNVWILLKFATACKTVAIGRMKWTVISAMSMHITNVQHLVNVLTRPKCAMESTIVPTDLTKRIVATIAPTCSNVRRTMYVLKAVQCVTEIPIATTAPTKIHAKLEINGCIHGTEKMSWIATVRMANPTMPLPIIVKMDHALISRMYAMALPTVHTVRSFCFDENKKVINNRARPTSVKRSSV